MLTLIRNWLGHTKPRRAKPRQVTRRHANTRDDVPMAQYNVADARDMFSYLLRRVRYGESLVIARAGEPVAKIVPYDGNARTRPGVIHAHMIRHDPEAEEPRTATPTRSSPEASTRRRGPRDSRPESR